MDINGISSGTNAILGTTAVNAQTTTDTSVSATDGTGVSVDISKPGQLFGQLSSLATSDPAKFKQVTADISQKLKDEAGTKTGKQADFLNQLADRFNAASQSGNAADLTPPKAQGHHGGHGHHHHGGGGGGGGGAGAGGSSSGNGSDLFQSVESIISDALNT